MVAVNGILLAGGKSKRMGQDKLSMPLANKPLIEHAIERIRPHVAKLYVICNDVPKYKYLASTYQVELIKDIFPGSGPLGGIYTGLDYSDLLCNFVAAADMPFMDWQPVELLLQHVSDCDGVVPLDELGFYEPLFAIYQKSCLTAIKSQLDTGDYKISRFYPQVKICFLQDVHFRHNDKIFFNVNTQADYLQLQAIVKEHKHEH
ncbi:MAG: molybdenum cofactor guanylyltransferase [Clostridia bacterium]